MKNNLLAIGPRRNAQGKRCTIIQLAIIAALACLLATCYLPAVMELEIPSAWYDTGANTLHIRFSPPMSDSGTFYIDEQLGTTFNENTYSVIFDIGSRNIGTLSYSVYADAYFYLNYINPPLSDPFTLNIHTDRWLYYDSAGDLFKTAAYKVRFRTSSIAVDF